MELTAGYNGTHSKTQWQSQQEVMELATGCNGTHKKI
jgi:CDGSH-type Zn-finger protein